MRLETDDPAAGTRARGLKTDRAGASIENSGTFSGQAGQPESCLHGHAWNCANTYHRPDPDSGHGWRNCRKCNSQAVRRYAALQQAEARRLGKKGADREADLGQR